jgi:hypothetical protein
MQKKKKKPEATSYVYVTCLLGKSNIQVVLVLTKKINFLPCSVGAK